MAEIKLKRVGEHFFDGGLYKDEKGRYYVDCNTDIEDGKEGTVYRLCPSNDPDGEPGWPYTGIIKLS